MKNITLEQSITIKVLKGNEGVLASNNAIDTLAYFNKKFDVEEDKISLFHSKVKLDNYDILDKLKGITFDILRENDLLLGIVTTNTIFFEIIPITMIGDEEETYSVSYHITLLGCPQRNVEMMIGNHVEYMLKCFTCIVDNKERYVSLFNSLK